MSAAGDEKKAIVLDVVMRNRVWKECALYVAASRRAAEAMYAVLCTQLGPDRRAEVVLDLGDAGLAFGEKELPRDVVRVVVTCPIVLKRNLATADDSPGWLDKASVLFIDDLSLSSVHEWEEILLGLPSRVLLCAFSKENAGVDRDLLPLWLESIQNRVVAISPPGAASLHDRIERPQSFPLLRTFAFNAAVHESPVQVSLTLLRDILQKEEETKLADFVPRYEECFLQGITMIPAEKAKNLMFRSIDEAQYTDVACLVVADAKRTKSQLKAKSKKRARASKKRKGRTASSRAAARRRREAIYAQSMLLPAIALIRGRTETENATFAIQSALGDGLGLLWDEDTEEQVRDLVSAYRQAHKGQLCDTDINILDALVTGIGIVHEGCAPAVRLFVEELYRGGLIPLLVADTHLGSVELSALPCAKSILIESSALAACDDREKGLIKASTAAALAGRFGDDDVGNLIVMWYDESVDDEAAGGEIASTLLQPLFSSLSALSADGGLSPFPESTYNGSPQAGSRSTVSNRQTPSALYSSYGGLLRSLRRFGVDGYKFILDYTFNSYRGWLERAALRATLEKMGMEKRAMDERIESEDWSTISDFERRTAKKNETDRVFRAMEQKFTLVATERIREELVQSQPGRVIGIESSKGVETLPYWEQKLLEGQSDLLDKVGETKPDEALAPPQGKDGKPEAPGKRERLSAAVFVAVRDQGVEGSRIKALDHRWLVVCILADGMWTMVSMEDVVALSEQEEDVVPNVDLLEVPHPATFDVDPSSEWAKCCPVDDNETAAVYRVSDDLISRIASDKRPRLERYQIPEFESQKKLQQKVDDLYRESIWHGREKEVDELRRLRRRAAQLGDDIMGMQKTENKLQEKLFKERSSQESGQAELLAVLEDCHAISIHGDQAMEMTPIGALGSVLPCQYPLFTAACLSLIDDVKSLSVSEFAAFVAVVSCSGRIWTANNGRNRPSVDEAIKEDEEYEEMDFSAIHQAGRNDELSDSEKIPSVVEGLGEILHPQVASTVNDIMEALQQLHRRHQNGDDLNSRSNGNDIVPKLLDLRLARSVEMFSSGASWRDVADELQQDSGYAVRQFRNIKLVLETIATDQCNGEFEDDIRELAKSAYESLDRWPVNDSETLFELIEAGVVEKHWNGNTYDKWWRAVRDPIPDLGWEGDQRDIEEVRSGEAEVVE
ncbi:unnamed protein product [Chondrus crispus]|uniref:Uncharacterized protein n=1 Tax=Chondrus crispus TaxID=2769 RepID=R7QEQ5_CHOCR|nr:unnamed protein product [Chondrus crispus]CDF36549.1 unnamed protein product [Chondrus crispus]|eukprot:XP_005716368.1 unnamed protein product [Chondrus crispus]